MPSQHGALWRRPTGLVVAGLLLLCHLCLSCGEDPKVADMTAVAGDMVIGGASDSGMAWQSLDGCAKTHVIAGMQGGFHIWASVRVRDVAPGPARLRVGLTRQDTGAVIPPGPMWSVIRLDPLPTDSDGATWSHYVGAPAFLMNPCALVGVKLRLDVTLDDMQGHEVSGSACLQPEVPPGSPAPCAPPLDPDAGGIDAGPVEVPHGSDAGGATADVVTKGPPLSPEKWSGGFTDVRKALGIADLPAQSATKQEDLPETNVVAGDFDGNGVQDFVVFNKRETVLLVYLGVKKADGTLAWTAEQLPKLDPKMPDGNEVWAAIPGDIDGDGRDELLTAGPLMGWWRWTPTGWHNGVYAHGIPLRTQAGVRQTVHLHDVDNDGLIDLVTPIYECNSPLAPEVWLDRGDGQFVDSAVALGLHQSGANWVGLMTDADMDGDGDFLWLNDGCNMATVQPFWRNTGRGPSGAPGFNREAPHKYFAFPSPVVLFTSPMGACSFDYDRDGRLDVFVTNVGFHPPPGIGPGKLGPGDPEMKALLYPNLFHGKPDGSWDEVAGAAGLKQAVDAGGGDLQSWSPGALDIDRDGWPDLVVAHSPETAVFWGEPNRAPMRPVIWRARGDGAFDERSSAFGLPNSHENRHLQIVDFDGDGDADLIFGGILMQPLVLRNDVSTPYHHVRIKLRGHTSNPLGIGAKVRVTAGGQTWLTEHGGSATHASRHEDVVDVGIGSATQASAEIEWPSGHVQKIAALVVDGLTLVDEPAIVTLPVRHVTTGAQTPIPIEIQPYSPEGKPLVAPVQVGSWPDKALVWATPLTCDVTGRCKGVIMGPSTEQTLYLKITIGGKALRIAPKITASPN